MEDDEKKKELEHEEGKLEDAKKPEEENGKPNDEPFLNLLEAVGEHKKRGSRNKWSFGEQISESDNITWTTYVSSKEKKYETNMTIAQGTIMKVGFRVVGRNRHGVCQYMTPEGEVLTGSITGH